MGPTQAELVILAVHLLGGGSRSVDTEDVAVKCHEISPEAFSWQKYKDQINLELVRVNLSNAKKEQNGVLLSGSGREGWRLTSQGVDWLHSSGLQLLAVTNFSYQSSRRTAGSIDTVRKNLELERVKSSQAWKTWISKGTVSPQLVRELFRIDAYSTPKMIESKTARLRSLLTDIKRLGGFSSLPEIYCWKTRVKKMGNQRAIKLTSHVGRDLLASAASFKTEHAVVWEYVVNSLQYVDDGIRPRVQVLIRPKTKEIEIRDNGRGMSENGLQQFFRMHGENIDRVRGRPGRGKFGTGKSAAFGIANLMEIDTRRDGVRNVVQLSREALDASKGDEIEVDWLIRNEVTALANGTTIAIRAVAIPRIQVSTIIEYIERHLQVFRAAMPEVAVNDHICQYKAPPVAETFSFTPTAEQAITIGNVELKINVSPSPLPDSDVGIAITAGLGNMVALETGGVERKELGNYIWGEIDVPLLETTKSPIEPYDPTRSLQLNPRNPVCSVLIPFIGSKIEEVRHIQQRKLNELRKGAQAKQLAAAAQKIADLLNQDFRNVMTRLHDIRAASARPGDAGALFGSSGSAGDIEDLWLEGVSRPGDVSVSKETSSQTANNQKKGREPPDLPKAGTTNPNGNSAVDPAGGSGTRPRPSGGFKVEYKELGDPLDRSKYDRATLTILINLDHPAVKNAVKSAGMEDVSFRRLSYEIALTEYSIALGYEMAERDPDIPADDLLFEVRSTLNRVAAVAADLYT